MNEQVNYTWKIEQLGGRYLMKPLCITNSILKFKSINKRKTLKMF